MSLVDISISNFNRIKKNILEIDVSHSNCSLLSTLLLNAIILSLNDGS